MVDAVTHPPLRDYTGEVRPKPGERDSITGRLRTPYIPSPDLVEAVRLAVQLERPLLLKGEPGCGKTRLAEAVAYELELPYEPWYIKSVSQARDGLYTYDAVRRLRDAQLAAARSGARARRHRQMVDDPHNYIRYEQLGRAFLNSQRTVVLIDEIDKADIDFPNDLLQELDELQFQVLETGDWIATKQPPIVFITSNDEKELSDAFLRRCLFYYIDFPDDKQMEKIVAAHFPERTAQEVQSAQEQVITAAVSRFYTLRQRMVKDRGGAGKKLSTSELLDWLSAMIGRPAAPEALKPGASQLGEMLGKVHKTDWLPFPSVLMKSLEDWKSYVPQYLQPRTA
jgi:MoxR-like ATPase